MIARKSNQIGKALETAVQYIERSILRGFPNYSEDLFKVEANKIVKVSGVRHEIDLFVTVDHGEGYASVFIFESKNWQSKVGKNEIVIFIEKIEAVSAQRGFFIAKSFTRDARAQAAANSRVELLLASEYPASEIMLQPDCFQGRNMRSIHVNVGIHEEVGSKRDKTRPFSLDTASFILNGKTESLKDYLQTWVNELVDDRCTGPRLRQGVHKLKFQDVRKFGEGEVIVNGHTARIMEISGIAEVEVRNATIYSAFDVESRGQCITLRLEMPGYEASVHQILTSPAAKDSG